MTVPSPTSRFICVLQILALLGFGPMFLPCSMEAADSTSPQTKPLVIQHVKAKEAQKLIVEKKVVVVDVRTPDEFAMGHIAGATNINFQAADFEKQISSLPKNATYLVHCASGGRSTSSLPVFQKQPFASVYHLDGGFKAWQKASLPIVK